MSYFRDLIQKRLVQEESDFAVVEQLVTKESEIKVLRHILLRNKKDENDADAHLMYLFLREGR